MSDHVQQGDPRTEAVQAVIDRVVSYAESADACSIRAQLTSGLAEVGVELDEDAIDKLVVRITERPEDIQAGDFI